ncbi:MAG: GGDEF domain-containing protein, partial [Oscillospiraceae bacterium]|nr:GGDEF domain-containing protein [Oscillospiraceae bacterium]
MNEGFQTFVDQLDTPACVLSVERKETDHRRAIHVIAGNRAYIDTIEKKIPGFNENPRPFVPDIDYTEYAPQDMNFEHSCIQAALYKKKINANVRTDHFDVWFNILFIPLHSDSEELGYCAYVMELSKEPDAAAMSSSASIASDVLETCIKLRSTDNFREAMKLICKDIRDLCDSEHCCFFMVDTHDRKCSVLCEALSDNTELLSMEAYVDDAFYAIAESWEATIAGSNCL